MANQQCRKCEELLEANDLLRATIICRFVPLKSKIAYALTKPSECIYVEHLMCNDPKGEYEADIDE